MNEVIREMLRLFAAAQESAIRCGDTVEYVRVDARAWDMLSGAFMALEECLKREMMTLEEWSGGGEVQ